MTGAMFDGDMPAEKVKRTRKTLDQREAEYKDKLATIAKSREARLNDRLVEAVALLTSIADTAKALGKVQLQAQAANMAQGIKAALPK